MALAADPFTGGRFDPAAYSSSNPSEVAAYMMADPRWRFASDHNNATTEAIGRMVGAQSDAQATFWQLAAWVLALAAHDHDNARAVRALGVMWTDVTVRYYRSVAAFLET